MSRRPKVLARASHAVLLPALLLAAGAWSPPANAQGAPPAAKVSPAPQISLDVLKGRWVRPDGGYMIAIRSVAADGKLDAAYANPRPLPFAVAEAKREGNTLRVFLELRAGGYDGSTYTLVYDPAADVLKGVYYQAVAKQRFDVQFARAK
jgi:hypothetical protein